MNFSVRQNKAIERSIVFDGLRKILQLLPNTPYIYAGMGSVWFVDFDMAHRDLGIQRMLSIEGDNILYERAKFNKPYRTVDVQPGFSHDVIPELLDKGEYSECPWVLWLDYDEALDETKLEELDLLVEKLPNNSVLLTTFNASGGRYEHNVQGRVDRFAELFGDSFPREDFQSMKDSKDENKVMRSLASAASSYLKSISINISRRGGFIEAFGLQYKDGSPMVTVGGVLPDPSVELDIRAEVGSSDWRAISSTPITTPPLTQKEVVHLRGLLPCTPDPTRDDVQNLGFDLLEDQLASFTEHYLKYPMFVETVR